MTVEERYLEKIMNDEIELVGELHNPFHSSIYGDYEEGLYVVCDADSIEELKKAGSRETFYMKASILKNMEVMNIVALKGFLRDYCIGCANDDTMEIYSVNLHTILLTLLLQIEG